MLLDLVLFSETHFMCNSISRNEEKNFIRLQKGQSIDAVETQTKHDLTVELTTKLCVISDNKFCNIVRFHLWVFVYI